MIHLSPQLENVPVSTESSPQGGAVKKESLGVFAKILAGLLRKAGEKDGLSAGDAAPGAENLTPDILPGEVPDSEDAASLIPGRRTARGKKSAGGLGPEHAGAGPPRNTRDLLTGAAGVPADRKGEKVSGDYLVFPLPPEARNGNQTPAEGAKGTVKPELASVGEEKRAGGEYEGSRSLESLDFGDLVGVRRDGAAEGEESPAGRKEKAGDRPISADSPEENCSIRPENANPGFFPAGSRQGGSGEKGRDDPPRPAEGRQKEKRRDKISLEVRDFRTGEDRNSVVSTARNLPNPEAQPLAGRGETEILVELRGDNPGREAPQAAEHGWESRAGRSFEDFLARELHQNLNGDIVRHASVALRDGGEGTIRLALRPESLGNVKIRLEMAENKITGHIIVESEAALRAFEREVSSLEQAFRDSGFDGADLDMSLAPDGGGSGRGRNGEEAGRPAVPERLAALRYDAAPERPDPAAGADRTGVFTRNGRIAVNMLV